MHMQSILKSKLEADQQKMITLIAQYRLGPAFQIQAG